MAAPYFVPAADLLPYWPHDLLAPSDVGMLGRISQYAGVTDLELVAYEDELSLIGTLALWDELDQAPARRVEPGPTEITVDLPWGSWRRTVRAPAVKKAVRVELPEQIGTPPLRCRLPEGPPEPTWRLSAFGDRAAVQVVPAGQTRTPLALTRRKTTVADWAVGLPRGADPFREGIVQLGQETGARFPMLSGWSLAVEWSAKGLRVEPLSSIASPEWDLPVATGRLDALSPADAVRLTEEKWFDAVLGLAGAYAV